MLDHRPCDTMQLKGLWEDQLCRYELVMANQLITELFSDTVQQKHHRTGTSHHWNRVFTLRYKYKANSSTCERKNV